jgi:hypothetical protein
MWLCRDENGENGQELRAETAHAAAQIYALFAVYPHIPQGDNAAQFYIIRTVRVSRYVGNGRFADWEYSTHKIDMQLDLRRIL